MIAFRFFLASFERRLIRLPSGSGLRERDGGDFRLQPLFPGFSSKERRKRSSRGATHSYRSASTGLTLVARRAGTKQATRATRVSRATAAPKVTGSLGCTPKSMLVRLSRYFVST